MVRHMQHMPHMPINVELKGFIGFLDFALAEHQAETETQYIIKKTIRIHKFCLLYIEFPFPCGAPPVQSPGIRSLGAP